MSEDEKNEVKLSDLPSDQKEEVVKPIVLKLKQSKKKSKKKNNGDEKIKYTRGLKNIQEFDGNMVVIARKATRALSKGVEAYDREREQSAREKKDGAIEDYFHNTAKASSTALREAADIPLDIADTISPIRFRKRVRRLLRRASKFIPIWWI